MKPLYNSELVQNSLMAHSDETKRAMSRALYRRWERRRKQGKMTLTKAHKEAISKSHIGIKPSEKTREKMSKKKQGKATWNKGLKGAQVAWNKGKEWSLEVKKKLSESHRGYVMPEEQKRKIGRSLRKYHMDI